MTAPSLQAYIQGKGQVSADNLNSFVQSCDNLAQLRAFVGLPGIQVYLRGDVTPGDGGQGNYYWDPTATGPDNGKTIIVPTGVSIGAWILIPVASGSAGTHPVSVFNYMSESEISDVLARTVNVDVTASIQAAISANMGTGNILYFPDGIYRVSGQFNVTAPLRIQGFGIYKAAINGTTGHTIAPSGTVFYMNWTSSVFAAQFWVTTGGFYIDGCEFYTPLQTDPSASPWTPATGIPGGIFCWDLGVSGQTPYAPTITDIMMRNLNEGIYFRGCSAGEINGLFGQAFNTMLTVDGSYDVLHVNKVHVWQYWSSAASVVTYQLNNSICLSVGRADEPHFNDIFAFQVANGIRLFSTGFQSNPSLNGNMDLANATNVTFDDVTYPIINLCTNTPSLPPRLNLDNFVFLCANHVFNPSLVLSSIGVYDGGFFGATIPFTVMLTNGLIQSTDYEAVRLELSGSTAYLNNVQIELYNISNTGRAGVSAGSGATIYLGVVNIDAASGSGGPQTDPSSGGTYTGTFFGGGGGAVTSFNTRTGAITLLKSDVDTAGYTGGVVIPSASTISLNAQTSNTLFISGTTTISSFGTPTSTAQPFFLEFEGVLTITNSSTLVCPGNADISTNAGDCAVVTSFGLGWRIILYTVAAVPPWSGGAGTGVSSFNTRTGAVTLTSGDVTGALTYTPPDFDSNNVAIVANTVDLPAAASQCVIVNSGTGPINSFGTPRGTNVMFKVGFGAAYTITNSSTLVCPGGADITTANGDSAWVESFGIGWRITDYTVAAVAPWSGGAGSGVSTFNTRSGAVVLLSSDVTSALTYTPPNNTFVTVASSGTVNLGSVGSNLVSITGTTTITSFGTPTASNQVYFVGFTGALTLTNSSSLICPGAANITTAAGDTCVVESFGLGWRVAFYQRAAVAPFSGAGGGSVTTVNTASPLTGGPITTTGTIGLGTVGVGNGGTGQTTLSANGVLLGNGASPINIAAAGTTGQVLTAVTGSAPGFQALPVSSVLGGTNISTSGSGAITVSVVSAPTFSGTVTANNGIVVANGDAVSWGSGQSITGTTFGGGILTLAATAGIAAGQTLAPSTDNAFTCGKSGNRWSAVWAVNGTIQTSDERDKLDVQTSDLGLDFINTLRPVSYRWKAKDNGKHYGLIAQEVELALAGREFYGLVKPGSDGESYAMIYSELISPLIRAIQQLTDRIEAIEAALSNIGGTTK